MEIKKHYFLVTDRKSLDKGHVTVNPVPMSVKGTMEYIGDCKLEIDNCVAVVEDDGSIEKVATLTSLRRKDGTIELTDKLVEKIVEVGFEMGVLENA